MGWKDNLLDASFRDVPFQVESSEVTGGRRTAVHEFPDKNINYIEDMGRATREFMIEAFVFGDDYQIARDALLQAVETKGPGELVHPYYGQRTVVASSGIRVQEGTRDGGYAKITITFSETEEPKYPLVIADTKVSLLASVNAAINSALGKFKKLFSVFKKAKAVIDGVSNVINNLTVTLSEGKSYAKRSIDFQNQLQNLTTNSEALALAMDKTGEDIENLGTVLIDLFTKDETASGVEENLSFQDFMDLFSIREPNAAALIFYIQQLAVIGAARSVLNVDFTSVNEAVKLRDTLSVALDRLMDKADEDLYPDIWELRCRLIMDIDRRAVNLPRVATITLPRMQNVLMLAYDLYEDIDRADEIISRNDIMHPGMIPAGVPLEVLTRE